MKAMTMSGRQGQGAAKVCEGGASLHPQGGAEGGAKVTFCEGIVRCTQPDDLSLSLSPRYES